VDITRLNKIKELQDKINSQNLSSWRVNKIREEINKLKKPDDDLTIIY